MMLYQWTLLKEHLIQRGRRPGSGPRVRKMKWREAMKKMLLIAVASSFLAIAGGSPAQAQVTETVVRADIPFAFMVRDTTLPAGQYTIKRLDSVNPNAMEIRNADGAERLVFLVGSAQAVTPPDQTKRVLDRVGDQYFLSEIFEVGNRTGVELKKSRAERQLEKEGEIGQLHSVAVPAQTGINASR